MPLPKDVKQLDCWREHRNRNDSMRCKIANLVRDMPISI